VVVTLVAAMDTDYRRHCQTLLPVQDINLTASSVLILPQIIRHFTFTFGVDYRPVWVRGK